MDVQLTDDDKKKSEHYQRRLRFYLSRLSVRDMAKQGKVCAVFAPIGKMLRHNDNAMINDVL